MDTEITAGVIDLISKLGIPTVLTVVLISVCMKYLPKIMDLWMEKQKSEQDYHTQRQVQYDEHMSVMFKQIEMSTRAIEQNTAAFERNTAAFERSVVTDEQLAAALCKLDRRTENMNIDIIKIAGKLGVGNRDIVEENCGTI